MNDQKLQQDLQNKLSQPLGLKAEKPRDQRVTVIISLVSMAVLMAVAWWFFKPKTGEYQLKNYRTATVFSGEFVQSYSGTGLIEAQQAVDITAPVSGVVQRMAVEGAKVQQGEILAVLNDPEQEVKAREAALSIAGMQAELQKFLAEYHSKKTELDYHIRLKSIALNSKNREIHKAKLLYAAGGLSLSQLQDLEASPLLIAAEIAYLKRQLVNLNNSKTQYLQSHNTLVQLTEQSLAALRSRGKVTAPFAGTVLYARAETGQSVAVGAPIMRLVNLKQTRVRGVVDVAVAQNLSLGQSATVGYQQGKYPATVRNISLQSNTDNQVQVLLAVTLPQPILDAQVSVLYSLLGKKDVLQVQKGDFVQHLPYVFVVEGQKAVRREVVWGESSDSTLAVISGLKLGDTIITSDYGEFADQDSITLL